MSLFESLSDEQKEELGCAMFSSGLDFEDAEDGRQRWFRKSIEDRKYWIKDVKAVFEKLEELVGN